MSGKKSVERVLHEMHIGNLVLTYRKTRKDSDFRALLAVAEPDLRRTAKFVHTTLHNFGVFISLDEAYSEVLYRIFTKIDKLPATDRFLLSVHNSMRLWIIDEYRLKYGRYGQHFVQETSYETVIKTQELVHTDQTNMYEVLDRLNLTDHENEIILGVINSKTRVSVARKLGYKPSRFYYVYRRLMEKLSVLLQEHREDWLFA